VSTIKQTQSIFNIADAARYWQSQGAKSATQWFVRSLVVSGDLPSQKIGRAFVITKADLDDYIAKGTKRSGHECFERFES
jgi:hypothetical protein